MILPKQQANAIASGRKTTHHTTNDALKVGAQFNVSYRDGKQLVKTCYVRIVAMEERELRDLKRDEAKREGYDGLRGPLNFRRAWLERIGSSLMEPDRETGMGPTDEAVAVRFAAQTGRIVHVLTLALAEEPDRWMARSSGRLTNRQSTSNPRDAIDELPLAPQAFVDAEATRIRSATTSTQAQARRDAALERMARALDTTNSKRANNAVRAMERMANSLERDIA